MRIVRLLFFALALVFFPERISSLGSETNALGGVAPPSDPYCSVRGEALNYMAISTRKMAGLLERLARMADPRVSPFLNRQRAEIYREQMNRATNHAERIITQAQTAVELVNAGETETGLRDFEAVERMMAEDPRGLTPRDLTWIRENEAMAYLRLGEQENCLTNHTSASCILPIQKEAVHKLQRGARGAIEILQEHLKHFPTSRKAIWLLNIAFMTIGEYPDGVPAKWLIPPEKFASEYDIKRFPDIAADLGLDINDLAGGTISEDFDGDGNLDLLFSDWSLRGPLHFFHNNGEGTFSDRTMETGLTGLAGGLNLLQGDFNNDGLPDVLVLRGAWLGTDGNHPDSLLRNDGKGHFTDVTEEAGLLSFDPNQTAVWFDFDGDGWLDLYFGYESVGDNVHPCKLFRNNHDGTFTECAAAAGVAAVGFVKGVVAGDFNNDGRPDLYLSRRGQPNILFRNDGPRGAKTDSGADWRFSDVSLEAGVTEPLASFPTWFFDYDNDGWEDIFVCGYWTQNVGEIAADYMGLPTGAERPRLYHNNHDGTFKDVTKEAGLYKVILGMGANFGDFDNDGWLDMLISTGDPDLSTIIPDRAFRNSGGSSFQDVTTSGGFGHLQKGHGVSFADFDNDGDQDIYHSVGGAYEGDAYRNVFYENPGHGQHWITLKLEGVKSNRVAIGARIKVVVDGEKGERLICRTVGTGGSFGANPLRQEIGLGKAQFIDRVEIFWPVTGKTDIIKDLAMDRFYRIREGDGRAERWDLKTFKFQKGKGPGGHLHTSVIHGG